MVKKLITRQIIFASLMFGFVLCLIFGVLQVFIFPNLVIENDVKFRMEVTKLSEIILNELETTKIPGDFLFTETPVIPGVFAVGMSIKVFGTENEGLNIRQKPGTDSPVVYLAQEGEVYKIIEGPELKDSLIWWNISQMPNGNKTGWAVQSYFSPLD